MSDATTASDRHPSWDGSPPRSWPDDAPRSGAAACSFHRRVLLGVVGARGQVRGGRVLDRTHDRVPFGVALAGDRHEVVHAEDRRDALGREQRAGELVVDVVTALRQDPLGQRDVERELHRVGVGRGSGSGYRHGIKVGRVAAPASRTR